MAKRDDRIADHGSAGQEPAGDQPGEREPAGREPEADLWQMLVAQAESGAPFSATSPDRQHSRLWHLVTGTHDVVQPGAAPAPDGAVAPAEAVEEHEDETVTMSTVPAPAPVTPPPLAAARALAKRTAVPRPASRRTRTAAVRAERGRRRAATPLPAWLRRLSGLGFEKTAVLAVVALLLVCGGLALALVNKSRADAVVATREVATAEASAVPANGPKVVVIGDAGVTDAAPDVATTDHWPVLLGSDLDGTVKQSGAPGSGYTVSGPAGASFEDLAGQVPEDADVVVFFGGAEDASAPRLALAKAATAAFGAALRRAPDAKVVAVGPAYLSTATAAQGAMIRSTLKSSAAIAQIRWSDPIAAKWLPAEQRTAVAGTALTADDQQAIATRMGALIRQAVG